MPPKMSLRSLAWLCFSCLALVFGKITVLFGRLMVYHESRSYPTQRCGVALADSKFEPSILKSPADITSFDTLIPLVGEVCFFALNRGGYLVSISPITSTLVVAFGVLLIALGIAAMAYAIRKFCR